MTQEQSVFPPQDGGNYTDRDGLEHPHRLPRSGPVVLDPEPPGTTPPVTVGAVA